jgi:hypothetical protein
MEQPTRPARKVAIADHIWDAFDEMAREMGSDRDGLINQAMYMFARLNGFLDGAGRTTRNAVATPARAPVQVLHSVDPLPDGAVERPAPRPEQETPRPEAQRLEPAERESAAGGEPQSLEKPNDGAALPALAGQRELLGDDQADGSALDSREDRAEQPEVSASPVESTGSGLFMITAFGEERVVKERLIIGRGKHCDLVINSGKVSREHASVVREGADWYIEDLGSSNGTWFNKQRIKRQKIEDGDEYFVCSERIRFALR